MKRDRLNWLLLAGVLAVSPLSQGIAHPLGGASAAEASVIAVQGWPGWQSGPGWQGGPGWGQDQERREHCWRLRNRAREIRDRMYYAPPWERQRMERHLWDIRERARAECWGGWRNWE
jgi:hypothetical protein